MIIDINVLPANA